MAHITSPNEPFPTPAHLSQATTTHRQGSFTISTRKLPISKAGPIDAMSDAIGIPIPEMIFGDNLVAVRHEPTGWAIEFNALDALDQVDKTGEKMLQVAYAREWSASREQTSAGIRDVVKPYDWSYSTEYRGTVIPPPSTASSDESSSSSKETEGIAAADSIETGDDSKATDDSEKKKKKKRGKWELAPSDRPIPLELLKRRDPILFFDEVMLYESELDDNGMSVLSVKVRVHEHRMLLLCRLYMRLDNVVVRVRDTRVYVDFLADEVTREWTARESSFEDVKKGLLMKGLRPDEFTVALRDANQIADILPIIDGTLEAISLKQ